MSAKVKFRNTPLKAKLDNFVREQEQMKLREFKRRNPSASDSLLLSIIRSKKLALLK